MLSQRERDVVADALGDSPETAIPAHLLRRGLAAAYVDGSMSSFNGVIVQSHSLPREPWCFGNDPNAVWGLLRELDEWDGQPISPNVSADLAVRLAALIEQDANVRVNHYGDVYHTLTGRINVFSTPEVRQLGIGDANLVAAHESNPHRMGFSTFEDLLTEGMVAGTVVENKLVAVAHTNAVTTGYGDIGVFTDEGWRGRGFATAAARIVAHRIREIGRTPVWSAGEDNAASLRVAAKLGFVEISRRVYLNVGVLAA